MSTYEIIRLNNYASPANAEISFDLLSGTALVVAKNAYIPHEDFLEIFSKAEEMIISHEMYRLIFDMSILKRLETSSLEWFYLDWKSRMYTCHGLISHCEILPHNPSIRENFKKKRNQILALQPDNPVRHTSFYESQSIEQAFE